jgi:hypothetical protein
MASGDSAPYIGVRGMGASAPELFTPSENIRYKQDLLSLGMAVLRDKSGAAMPPDEVETELHRYGVFSGDSEVARDGLAQLYAEAASRASSVGIDPRTLGVPSTTVRME